jgi:hypothetical protein
MLAEWSVECAADDPVLVVPWKDPEGACAFVDLRANPYDFDLIPETEHCPAMMQALRALNATRSSVFTAKCDVWEIVPDGLAELVDALELEPANASAGYAGYIDLVARDRALFTSFHLQEQMLRRLTRLAEVIRRPYAAMECVLRPAFIDFGAPRQGYAVSLYIKAAGSDLASAIEEWSNALAAAVALLRGKDLLR